MAPKAQKPSQPAAPAPVPAVEAAADGDAGPKPMVAKPISAKMAAAGTWSAMLKKSPPTKSPTGSSPSPNATSPSAATPKSPPAGSTSPPSAALPPAAPLPAAVKPAPHQAAAQAKGYAAAVGTAPNKTSATTPAAAAAAATTTATVTGAAAGGRGAARADPNAGRGRGGGWPEDGWVSEKFGFHQSARGRGRARGGGGGGGGGGSARDSATTNWRDHAPSAPAQPTVTASKKKRASLEGALDVKAPTPASEKASIVPSHHPAVYRRKLNMAIRQYLPTIGTAQNANDFVFPLIFDYIYQQGSVITCLNKYPRTGTTADTAAGGGDSSPRASLGFSAFNYWISLGSPPFTVPLNASAEDRQKHLTIQSEADYRKGKPRFPAYRSDGKDLLKDLDLNEVGGRLFNFGNGCVGFCVEEGIRVYGPKCLFHPNTPAALKPGEHFETGFDQRFIIGRDAENVVVVPPSASVAPNATDVDAVLAPQPTYLISSDRTARLTVWRVNPDWRGVTVMSDFELPALPKAGNFPSTDIHVAMAPINDGTGRVAFGRYGGSCGLLKLSFPPTPVAPPAAEKEREKEKEAADDEERKRSGSGSSGGSRSRGNSTEEKAKSGAPAQPLPPPPTIELVHEQALPEGHRFINRMITVGGGNTLLVVMAALGAWPNPTGCVVFNPNTTKIAALAFPQFTPASPTAGGPNAGTKLAEMYSLTVPPLPAQPTSDYDAVMVTQQTAEEKTVVSSSTSTKFVVCLTQRMFVLDAAAPFGLKTSAQPFSPTSTNSKGKAGGNNKKKSGGAEDTKSSIVSSGEWIVESARHDIGPLLTTDRRFALWAPSASSNHIAVYRLSDGQVVLTLNPTATSSGDDSIDNELSPIVPLRFLPDGRLCYGASRKEGVLCITQPLFTDPKWVGATSKSPSSSPARANNANSAAAAAMVPSIDLLPSAQLTTPHFVRRIEHSDFAF